MSAATKPRNKPKPPPYPRPVASITVEELLPRPTDDAFSAEFITSNGVVTVHDTRREKRGNAAESRAESRSSKRRRIEENAHAYLRGQQLYILSAQLKGPLGKEWTNPWAQRGNRGADALTAVGGNPGHSQIANQKLTLGKVLSVRATSTSDQNILRRSRRIDEHSQKKDTAAQQPMADGNSMGSPSAYTNAEILPPRGAEARDRKKITRVADWLRTNSSVVEAESEPLSQTSPTPAHHKNTMVQVPRSFGEQTPLTHNNSRRRSAAFERVRQLSRNINDIITEPQMEARTPRSAAIKGKPQAERNMSRAESAIAEIKRKTLAPVSTVKHQPPSDFSTTVDATSKFARSHLDTNTTGTIDAEHQSLDEIKSKVNVTVLGDGRTDISKDSVVDEAEPNDRVVTSNAAHDRNRADIDLGMRYDTGSYHTTNSVVEPASMVSAQESTNLNMGEKCCPSSLVLEQVTVDALPSAQNPPRLHPSISSGVFDGQMLDVDTPQPECETSQSHAGQEAADQMTDDILKTNAIPIANSVHNGRDIEVVREAEKPQYFSMGKQTSNRTSRQGTAVTCVKNGVERKRKRTSFLVERSTSNASFNPLKDAMKAKVVKSFGKSTQLSTEKPATDQENYGAEHATVQKALPWTIGSQNNGSRSTKGILKSTATTNSQRSNGPYRSAFSSSQQQDGQGNNLLHHEGVQPLDDEAFDLEAAIDDLGSFLGSWNAEKEASGLAGT